MRGPAAPATQALHRLAWLGPALACCALLGWTLAFGFRNPLTWPLLAFGAAGILILVLVRAPLVVLWLVPIAMAWPRHHPLQPFEALVLLMAGALALGWYLFDRRDWPFPHAIEWCYGMFLLVLIPGIFIATRMTTYLLAVKIFIMGFVAFEVARLSAQRYGRKMLLWGPAAFVGLTLIMLAARFLGGDVPSSGGLDVRIQLTNIGWGTTNYVAAVLVLCLPALVLLWQLVPAQGALRWVTGTLFISSLASVLLTSSRGGFVLSTLYVLFLAARARRSLWIPLSAIGVLVLTLFATPLGEFLMSRFTSTRGVDSALIRVLIWQFALGRGLDHLPFGIGAGQGIVQRDLLLDQDPHNFLLTLFGELGPLGLLLWLALPLTLWRAGTRLLDAPESRVAGQALRATVVLSVLNCLFEPTFPGSLYHLLFWWLVGIYYGAGPIADDLTPKPSSGSQATRAV